jgi:hypothetical protein
VELRARNPRPKLRYAVIPIRGSVVTPIEDSGQAVFELVLGAAEEQVLEIVIEIDHAGEGKLAPSDEIVGHWRVIEPGNSLNYLVFQVAP